MALVAAAGAVLTIATWLPLRVSYGRKRSGQPEYPSTSARRDLDRLVDKVTIASVLVPTILIGALEVAGREQISSLAAIVAGIAVVLITGGMFWSSLVDWYWVLPRISGIYGARPCRRGDENGPAPVTAWDVVTSLWYGHRTASVISIFLGAGALVGAIVGAISSAAAADPTVTKALALVTGVVPLVAGVFVKRVPVGFAQAIRPTFTLGEAYAVAGPVVPTSRWVVDVSLEGAGTMDIAEHRTRYTDRRTHGRSQFGAPKHDRVVPLGDLEKENTSKAGFGDCGNGICCGINWYCVENVNFARKP
jgi:hypothetical protein